ncbi:universal stress protein [Chryseolinea sp. H1M3-3]|uniref:universal stress protein n=1 Tax=Chryseolinea sp. H1M3-3 TaxID=3034144 RepID=UPI0023EE16E8|nr:universal stress protein [Chryseolinea sp. H1M3-3]
MKKILVPTDFSPCANAAMEVAIRMAQKGSAEIFFLHLYFDNEISSHVPHQRSSLPDGHHQNAALGKAKDSLDKMVSKAEVLGICAEPILIFAKGQERIEDYLIAYHIDFVVMGSHGVSGIKETFLGSNTQRFVRRSPVPVLVIKEDQRDFDIKKIVYMSSFEEDSVKSFQEVIEASRLWNAEIYLLYVNTPYHFRETHESMVDIGRFMHQFPRISYTPVIFNALDEERGLTEFCKQSKIDLIVLTTHGKRGFYRLLAHGVAESIINHQSKPVLVINTNEKLTQERALIEEAFTNE